MNMSLIYGIVSVASLLLAIGYCCFVRKKDIWLFLLHISVFVVNLGYFSLSISKTLEEALLANRISYLGSVFLPLCMLMSVAGVCKIRLNKSVVFGAVTVGCCIFLLAASGGWLDIYYKEVSLVIENGTSRLEKVYGELHILYLVYLVVYFALMLGFVTYAIVRKKLSTYKYAAMLTVVVLLNLLIWFLEQFIDTDFEFLSVSYIVSEILLLFIYSMLKDHRELNRSLEKATAEVEKKSVAVKEKVQKHTEDEIEKVIVSLELAEKLTSREEEVLRLTLSGRKRKDIADALYVSENTIKTHLSHIFAKVGVSSKKELTDKLFDEKE